MNKFNDRIIVGYKGILVKCLEYDREKDRTSIIEELPMQVGLTAGGKANITPDEFDMKWKKEAEIVAISEEVSKKLREDYSTELKVGDIVQMHPSTFHNNNYYYINRVPPLKFEGYLLLTPENIQSISTKN